MFYLLKKVLKISELKTVASVPQSPLLNRTKNRKIRAHRNSKKFNSHEYEKCRENLKEFVGKLSKNEAKNFLNLRDMQKEYKVNFEQFPRDGEIMGLFDTIYRR